MHLVTLLLTAAVLAGASVAVESSTADTPGDLKDKTDNEDESKEMHISWEAAEDILELVDELGNVTSRCHMFLCITVAQRHYTCLYKTQAITGHFSMQANT